MEESSLSFSVVSSWVLCVWVISFLTADTFKIGGIGPTTGDAAIYGKAVQNGIKLAVDEVNAAGGINGKKIE